MNISILATKQFELLSSDIVGPIEREHFKTSKKSKYFKKLHLQTYIVNGRKQKYYGI